MSGHHHLKHYIDVFRAIAQLKEVVGAGGSPDIFELDIPNWFSIGINIDTVNLFIYDCVNDQSIEGGRAASDQNMDDSIEVGGLLDDRHRVELDNELQTLGEDISLFSMGFYPEINYLGESNTPGFHEHFSGFEAWNVGFLRNKYIGDGVDPKPVIITFEPGLMVIIDVDTPRYYFCVNPECNSGETKWLTVVSPGYNATAKYLSVIDLEIVSLSGGNVSMEVSNNLNLSGHEYVYYNFHNLVSSFDLLNEGQLFGHYHRAEIQHFNRVSGCIKEFTSAAGIWVDYPDGYIGVPDFVIFVAPNGNYKMAYWSELMGTHMYLESNIAVDPSMFNAQLIFQDTRFYINAFAGQTVYAILFKIHNPKS